MNLGKEVKIENSEKTIVYDGVEKNLEQLLTDHRRYKLIFGALCFVATYATYWAFGAGVGGFIAFIFLILPTYVITFVYFSKIKSNKILIKKLKGEYVENTSVEDISQLNIPSNIKRSTPFLAWSLILVTGGLYFFVWLYKMMSNINEIHGRPVFNIGRIIYVTVFLLLAYLTLFYFHVRAPFPEVGEDNALYLARFWVLFFIAMCWIGGIIYFQIKISKHIASFQKRLGLVNKASAGDTIFLFFLCYASVPYLQSKFNSLVMKGAPNNGN